MLPQPKATIVATASIAQDQESIFVLEAWSLMMVPPRTDSFYSQFGCVVRCGNIDTALIVEQVVDAEGNSDGESILTKVVTVDLFCLPTPDAAFVKEGANQLLVLGIDADYRSSARLKELLDPFDVLELPVSVWMRWPTQILAVGYQSYLVFLQQTSHGRRTDGDRCLADLIRQSA